MRTQLVAPVVAAAIALPLMLAVASCGGDDEGAASATREGSTVATAQLERARVLIRNCRVRSTLSLHSGAFYLELKDGSHVELPPAIEPQIQAEIKSATPRCGSVAVAME